jgi:methionyl-tRNA formyltransferase
MVDMSATPSSPSCPLRVIFMGTPQFSVPCLAYLLAQPHIQVVGVVTQPDKPSGRGQQLMPPPVKVLAQTHGIPVIQPVRLRKDEDAMAWLETLAPDYLITIAFGQILPDRVLAAPGQGTVNVHASLLPAYRGPNPIQWALLNGDKETGLTTMLTDAGVDTGAMLLVETTPITADDTLGSLTDRLAEQAGPLLVDTLNQLSAGTLTGQAQVNEAATLAPKLPKTAFAVDWTQPAGKVMDQVRALTPWPGAITMLGDMRLKISPLIAPTATDQDLIAKHSVNNPPAGKILAILKQGLLVQTGSIPIWLTTLQPPGKKPIPASDWARNVLASLPPHEWLLSAPVVPDATLSSPVR